MWRKSKGIFPINERHNYSKLLTITTIRTSIVWILLLQGYPDMYIPKWHPLYTHTHTFTHSIDPKYSQSKNKVWSKSQQIQNIQSWYDIKLQFRILLHARDQIFVLILCLIFHLIFVTSSCVMLFHSKCLCGTQG